MINELGEKIKRLRKSEGLTLEKLAELSGSSKSYIWELENKNPPRPSAEKLSKIAFHLKTTIEYLIDPNDEITEIDAEDENFYRKYKKMKPEAKDKFKKMIELWGDDTE